MRKTILTVIGAALIAGSAMSMASAAEQHRAHRAPVATTDQFRNSNAYEAPSVAVQPEWPGYGYGDGYYSRGFSAPAGR
jgi:hypothetical protein